jgi:general secretion pathway protein D
MVINESTEEIASTDPVLGPTTSKRTAKTTVVAKDQETVVIGGIIQERTIESIGKVPILGDLPLLGQLFRETSHRKQKINLILFLTPYINRDSSDFRRIFDKKMAERQKFVEEFYGQVPGYDVPIDFNRKPGPLAKMNQLVMREELKAENGGPGLPGEPFRPGPRG